MPLTPEEERELRELEALELAAIDAEIARLEQEGVAEAAQAQQQDRTTPTGIAPIDYVRENIPVLGDVLTGFGAAATEAEMAARQLAQDDGLTPQQQNTLTRSQAMQGPGVTAGRIAAQIPMYAAPAAAGVRTGMKAASMLPRALAARAATPAAIAGGAGAEAGTAYITTPGSQQERERQALVTGTLAAAVPGAPAAVKGVRAGWNAVRPGLSEAGEQVVSRGIRATPGQVVDDSFFGNIIRAVDDRLARAPVSGPAVQRLREQAVADFNADALTQVDNLRRQALGQKPLTRVAKIGHEGLESVKRGIQDGYDAIFTGDVPTRPLPQFRLQSPLGADDAKVFDDVLSRIRSAMGGGPTTPGKRLQGVQKILNNASSSAYRDGRGDLIDALSILQEMFTNGIADDALKATWQRLNAAWRHYNVLQRAGTYKGALARGGVFEPDQLLQAAAVGGNRGAAAVGKAPFQQSSREAWESLGRLRQPETDALGQAVNLIPGAAARPFVNEATRSAIVDYLRHGPRQVPPLTEAQLTGLLTGGSILGDDQ